MKSIKWVLVVSVGLVLFACLREDTGRADLSGSVTHVRDGDTIEVSGVPVRLSGLTCDERNTSRGASATRAVTNLVNGQALSCTLTGEKSYDREVGRCRLPDGRDIGTELILARECGRCERYDPEGTYIAPQKMAGPYNGVIPKYCRV
ncbi:thermonuclease family protein [Ruegeria arenilitoris]|uniref:thermonuclease family protein n=1 Tax=Ruegeria arenilitoris TaxID=1173585 RepID=UPI00147E7325|nr:hypothetical protein [Ruegeria arenilitoris]